MTAQEMWDRYCVQSGTEKSASYEAWAFCGGGPLADELAGLVLKGIKTATSSPLIAYEAAGEPIPRADGFSVILSSSGEAVCVIRNRKVSLVPFCEVSREHAYKEGEGKRTLEEWRDIHQRAFMPDFRAAGRAFEESEICVLEEFELVYPLKASEI